MYLEPVMNQNNAKLKTINVKYSVRKLEAPS